MLGPFKLTSPLNGGLLWKVPWRMSRHQKQRQRERLRAVDDVISKVTLGMHIERCENRGMKFEEALEHKPRFQPRNKMLRLLNRSWFFRRESQMSAKDKYTVYDKKSPGYRKGVHKVPKWTKLSLRDAPRNF